MLGFYPEKTLPRLPKEAPLAEAGVGGRGDTHQVTCMREKGTAAA